MLKVLSAMGNSRPGLGGYVGVAILNGLDGLDIIKKAGVWAKS